MWSLLQNKYTGYVTAALVLLCIGFFLGKSTTKPDIKTTDKQTSSEVDTKTSTNKKEKIKETRPDGTVIEREIEETNSSQTTKKDQSKQLTIEKSKRQFKAGAYAKFDIDDLKKLTPEYVGTASYRVLEHVWADSYFDFSDKSLGIGASVEF